MKNFIDLQTAYATQTTNEPVGKGEWIVYNTENEIIFRLPKEWTEKEVMFVIHFGRKFELIAFNKGVEFQKEKNPETIKSLQKMVVSFEEDRKHIVNRNITLSNELEKLNEQLDLLTINNN